MKIKYDKEVDVLNIQFNENAITETNEEKPGIIIDYDASGNIVEIEVLNYSKRESSPAKVEYEFA
ncbi:MAG: hypothetical protein HW421_503 [Ignavibacteria bacterium]|nr:hypothetical protein [Ignavibacteria bacterium]